MNIMRMYRLDKHLDQRGEPSPPGYTAVLLRVQDMHFPVVP